MKINHVRCALHQAHAGPHLFVTSQRARQPILGECLAKPDVITSDVVRKTMREATLAGERKKERAK